MPAEIADKLTEIFGKEWTISYNHNDVYGDDAGSIGSVTRHTYICQATETQVGSIAKKLKDYGIEIEPIDGGGHVSIFVLTKDQAQSIINRSPTVTLAADTAELESKPRGRGNRRSRPVPVHGEKGEPSYEHWRSTVDDLYGPGEGEGHETVQQGPGGIR